MKFKVGDEVILIKIPNEMLMGTVSLGTEWVIVSTTPGQPWNLRSKFDYIIASKPTSAGTYSESWYCDKFDIVLAENLTNFEKIMYGVSIET